MTVLVTTIKRFVGEKIDKKPIAEDDGKALPAGSTFLEQDTGDLYIFTPGRTFPWIKTFDTALAAQSDILAALAALLTESQAQTKVLNEIASEEEH